MVNSVRLHSNLQEQLLSIDEEVLAVNDKTALDFADECSYLLWYIQLTYNKYIVTKKNGIKVTVQ